MHHHNSIKIETYWNVNYKKMLNALSGAMIKIETYWNVNSFKQYFT